MKIENKAMQDYVLRISMAADKEEFDQARRDAYMQHSDRYAAPGYAGGLAPLEELEKLYGPAVLYDEALDIMIPKLFQAFLSSEGIRIMGKPQVDDLQFTNGGVSFHVKADVYPEVRLGQYKGIQVPFRRGGEQDQFERAVLQQACENMDGEIPPHMVQQKLSSIVAREKLSVSNEAIYHLLADALVILKQAYESAGAARPMEQIRREAMDLMLQTASGEHEHDWKEFFRTQIMAMAQRYRDLPADFDKTLREIVENRMKAKNAMKQDDLIEEIFKAYLGSLELTEEQWKNQRQLQAAKEACLDLLLDAVAKEESLTVDAAEVRNSIEDIAARCNMSPEEVENKMDLEPLRWQLLRDKAMVLVLDSAETDEILRAKKAADARKTEKVERENYGE